MCDACPQEEEKNNCLAILAFASLLWATEAVPLFATAMLVPPLVVILRVSKQVLCMRCRNPNAPACSCL